MIWQTSKCILCNYRHTTSYLFDWDLQETSFLSGSDIRYNQLHEIRFLAQTKLPNRKIACMDILLPVLSLFLWYRHNMQCVLREAAASWITYILSASCKDRIV
jgi:hypothetical protein